MFGSSDFADRATYQEVQAKLGSCRFNLFLKSLLVCIPIVDLETSCTTASRHAESNEMAQPV